MTTYLGARLGLTADAPLPKCHMGGTDKGIPIMEWKDADLYISFGLLDDPAAYLRDLAHALTALAHEVDQGRDRQPTGYAAPVVGATS
jgi:hypothetical protein